MIITHNTAVREALSRIINDPDYNEVVKIPLVSMHQIGLIILAYCGISFGIIGNLYFELPLWLVYPVMVYSMFIGFTPLHDGTHQAVSSNKTLNDILGTISGQTLFPGLNMATYRALHLQHHRFLGDKDLDPDERFVRWPKMLGPVYLLFVDLHWSYWFFTKAWNIWPKNIRPWVIGSLISIAAIYTVGLSSSYWWEFLTLFIIPHRLAIVYVTYMFAHIQHPEGLTWNKEPFQSTVKITGNILKRLSLLGQADHCMHHLLPHVPWYNYHKVWQFSNGLLKHKPIPERGIFSSVKEIIMPKENNTSLIKQRVLITSIRSVASHIKELTFEPLNDDNIVPFDAGSHIDVHLPNGSVRQYSLLNDPFEKNRYQIAVKLDLNGKGGSKEVHENLNNGDIIEVSTPRNNFTLFENARHFVLIGGGIGITPLLSMAHRLNQLNKTFELHICARTQADIALFDTFNSLPFASNIHIHLTENIGHSSIDIEQILQKPITKALLYICGPNGFMQWIQSNAEKMNWPPEHIYIEKFSANQKQTCETKAFEVELAKTGKTIQVRKDESILDALQHQNITVPYACMQGTCGTCIASVLKGEIDHRDAYLSDDEREHENQICVCISRAKNGRLTLDL